MARLPVKGKKKWRGTPLPKPLPDWWLDRVKAIQNKKNLGTEELGEMLAKIVGKPEAFDHGVVSRFLNNKVVTYEMVDAFVQLFGVPPIWFEARSLEEAVDLAAEHHDLSADQRRRLQAADQAAEIERQAAIDQRDGVTSSDEVEGAGRDRRPRRPARRGPSSS